MQMNFVDDPDKEYLAVIEPCGIDAVRLIILERDFDTGARSVRDIIEMSSRIIGTHTLDHCDLFEMDLSRDVKAQVEFDFGRASSPKGFAKKMNDQAPLLYAKLWTARESTMNNRPLYLISRIINKRVQYRASEMKDGVVVATFQKGEEI